MSKYNVGDSFEIEIGEVFKGPESGNDRYRIKGFDSLVFDDKGLDRLNLIHKHENYSAFIYSVKYIDGMWVDPEFCYSVPIQGDCHSLNWCPASDNNGSVVGAMVVVSATLRHHADHIFAQELIDRNSKEADTTSYE